MPRGELSTEADEVAKNVHLYKTFEELPLVNTGCDSYASWHPAFKDLSNTYTVDEIVEKMLILTPNGRWEQKNGNDVHLVITGGEPLLGWQRTYEELLSHPRMQDIHSITFETNGTQELSSKFKEFLDEWYRGDREITFSVSPKLSASGEAWEEAIQPEVVVGYQNYGYTYLKFVVETEAHFDEVDRAVAEYIQAGFHMPVYVMPQGGVVTPYEKNRVNVANWALARGYNYSPRLHVDLWGNGWGK
jgi:organic radical activating enzyme